MFNKLVVVVLVALIGSSSAIFAVTAVRTAVSVINEVTTLVTGMDGLINLIENDKTNELFQEEVKKKLDDIHTVCTGIDDVKGRIDILSNVMKENNDQLIASIQFSNAKRIVADFKKNVDYVNKIYFDRYIDVWDKIKNYKPETVDNHILGIVSDSSFDRAMSEMLSDITSSPNSQSSIFSAMSQYYDTKNGYKFRCENISPLDDLHIFYSNVVTTFARGYAVLLSSYEYLKLNTNDHEFYQDRQDTAFKNFKEAIDAITAHAKIDFDLITDSDYRASYSCDSKPWEEGRNFIRVKNYISFQFLTFYWPSSEDEHPSTPAEDPNEYDCPNYYAEYKRVPGAEFDTSSWLCTTPFSPNLTNPYSVEYKELVHPWNRIWDSRRCGHGSVDYYYSTCDLDHNSDPFLSIRKLSLRLQQCDTSINEVVTDAIFHEQDNKIQIKLQCGVLKDGTIDADTLRWIQDDKPLSETDPQEYVVLSSKLKSFNLDNVVVPNGELVTGAGFKVVDDHFISLVVKANKVNNYGHGNTFGGVWWGNIYSAPNSEESRKNIDISLLERPPKNMEQTHEIGKAGENYVSLTLSTWSRIYHNEMIVPYFDMSPFLEHYFKPVMAPLGGLGLFYKSLPNYTGFFAFKHLSPTYVYFVNTNETVQSSLENAQRP